MLSTRSRAVLVAVLGVVALALAATAVQVPSPATDADGGRPAGDPGGVTGPPSLPEVGSTEGRVTLLTALVFTALLFAMGGMLLKNAGSTAAAGLGAVVLVALLSGLFFVLSRGGSAEARNVTAANGTPGTGATSGGGPSAVVFAPVAVLVLGVVVVAGGVVLSRRLGSPRPGTDSDGGAGEAPDPDAVGRTAARAAERIRSEAATDNEVYRCWVEMTELVDTPAPESYTPAEFARAAVDAGMDPKDVAELRRLFEDVRYGPASPEECADRALSVFERIEAEYASEDSTEGDAP